MKSNCIISFYRNDLQRTRLWIGKCPVKNCTVDIKQYKVPFQRFKGKMRYLPFCPEHGIRIHKNGFVYYNGASLNDLIISTKRNLMFHSDYYAGNFFKKGNKMESGRLCYESNEDAVSYNVFTELLSNGSALKRLVGYITKRYIKEDVELYLWGGKIDFKNNSLTQYKPLIEVRKHLERGIKRFGTEPDIMLIVPRKAVICIEAKFGSKNPVAKEKVEKKGEKPRNKAGLITRYCDRDNMINVQEIFDFRNMPKLFYEQLFRNIVFAASMAKLEDNAEWYVVNLRNQHVMNLKRGKPESLPIMRNIRSILKSRYKKRFTHLTWEDIYNEGVEGNKELANLTWYFKNKSLNCGRAFNIL